MDSKTHIGETVTNRFGAVGKIIEYHNCKKVVVEFQDEHKYHLTTTYQNFLKGQIRNPYTPTIYGKGYLGEGTYPTKDPKNPSKQSQPYSHWNAMMVRVYRNDDYVRNQKYKTCEVAEEWLCYQNFAKWYCENVYALPTDELLCVDKDILVPNNQVYSPDTCLIVPQSINMFFANLSADKMNDLEYVSNKEMHLSDLADHYKAYLPTNTYLILKNYSLQQRRAA